MSSEVPRLILQHDNPPPPPPFSKLLHGTKNTHVINNTVKTKYTKGETVKVTARSRGGKLSAKKNMSRRHKRKKTKTKKLNFVSKHTSV